MIYNKKLKRPGQDYQQSQQPQQSQRPSILELLGLTANESSRPNPDPNVGGPAPPPAQPITSQSAINNPQGIAVRPKPGSGLQFGQPTLSGGSAIADYQPVPVNTGADTRMRERQAARFFQPTMRATQSPALDDASRAEEASPLMYNVNTAAATRQPSIQELNPGVPLNQLSPLAMNVGAPAGASTQPPRNAGPRRPQTVRPSAPGAPAMSSPKPAAASPTPLIPQLPAALQAPAGARSPIAPAQTMPLENTSNMRPSLTAMGETGPMGSDLATSQSRQAMEAYAANRARQAGMGPMTDIDRAREAYINAGARPVLDVNQPGQPIVAKQRRGIGEILKTAGAGALGGFARGGIAGALGGALTGGIAQAFSPEAGRRLRFETLERPGLEQAQQQQAQQFQQAQQQALTQAQIENLQSQVGERQADIALRQEAGNRANKYINVGRGDVLLQRGPDGRLTPAYVNEVDMGGGRQEREPGPDRQETEALKALDKDVKEVEALKAAATGLGSDAIDQLKGGPEFKKTYQEYQARIGYLRETAGQYLDITPVQGEGGLIWYNITPKNSIYGMSRPALVPPGQQKPPASQPVSQPAGKGKVTSSQIAPRPLSGLPRLD